jgi:hypothetical protein
MKQKLEEMKEEQTIRQLQRFYNKTIPFMIASKNTYKFDQEMKHLLIENYKMLINYIENK